MTSRVFFSHPLGTYDSHIEDRCLRYLGVFYYEYHIVDPKYIQFTGKLETSRDFEAMMQDFILPVVRNCEVLAYLKTDDYAPGVDMEVAEAKACGLKMIDLRSHLGRVEHNTVDEWQGLEDSWMEVEMHRPKVSGVAEAVSVAKTDERRYKTGRA